MPDIYYAPKIGSAKMATDKAIQEYQDAKTGLSGVNAFARAFAQRHQTTEREVKEALLSVDAATMNAPVRHNFPRRHVYVHNIDELWAADLMDTSQQANDNGGVRYLLVVVDVFSKFLWVEPVTTKSGPAIVEAFTKILSQGRHPQKLWTDKGTEFFNKQMTALLNKYKTEHYTTQNEGKSVIVERMIRTLRLRLARLFDARHTFKYTDALPDIVAQYNRTRHSTIKMAPIDASNPSNTEKVLAALAAFWGGDGADGEPTKPKPPKFKAGDTVRITRKRGIFTKESVGGWTRELFTIDRVLNTDPITYTIKDLKGEEIKGTFYEQELLRANPPAEYQIEKIVGERGRGKNKEVLVKWLGYDDSFNSWVKESEVKDLVG
jgi:hypothetical protein